MINQLLRHETALRQDMVALGVEFTQRNHGEEPTPLAIWSSMSDMCRARDAKILPDTETPPMQTSFGDEVVNLLKQTPEGTCEFNRTRAGLTACTLAEKYFLATLDSSYVNAVMRLSTPGAQPIVIEHEDEMAGIFKPYFNPSILGFKHAPGIYPGAMSGFPDLNSASVLQFTANTLPGAPLVQLASLAELVGEPLLIRPTTFLLDEHIRADFSRAIEQPILGVGEMQKRAEDIVANRQSEARKIGDMLLRSLSFLSTESAS